MSEFSQKTFVLSSGERYCILINGDTNHPLFYPNLYITTQVRNKSLSFSTMESNLNSIAVLLRFMSSNGDDIEKKFQCNDFLKIHELDAIRDYCQEKIEKKFLKSNVIHFPVRDKKNDKVGKQTEYTRLTNIANYVKWLAGTLSTSKDKNIVSEIKIMFDGLKARRPVTKYRNTVSNKSLTIDQVDILFEIFRPNSEINPFKNNSAQIRNRLIFLFLYYLGLRGGELLNLRIRDFDFANNQVVIARRSDDINDPRKDQPLVKTRDRRLPVKDTFISEVHKYIINERKNTPNTNKNDFLFVTHKAGATIGQPLSKVGYQKVIKTISDTSPILRGFSGHSLRHTWNDNFSKKMDTMDKPPTPENQEKMRSYLMGWREGSGTAETYNKRFIQEQANKASLILQEDKIRLPEGLEDE
jgi:integrase